jgi:hypothetical protein
VGYNTTHLDDGGLREVSLDDMVERRERGFGGQVARAVPGTSEVVTTLR